VSAPVREDHGAGRALAIGAPKVAPPETTASRMSRPENGRKVSYFVMHRRNRLSQCAGKMKLGGVEMSKKSFIDGAVINGLSEPTVPQRPVETSRRMKTVKAGKKIRAPLRRGRGGEHGTLQQPKRKETAKKEVPPPGGGPSAITADPPESHVPRFFSAMRSAVFARVQARGEAKTAHPVPRKVVCPLERITSRRARRKRIAR